MTVEFADNALQELYDTGKTKDRRYKTLCRDARLVQAFVAVVRVMYKVTKANDLKQFSYLHYEKLRHRPESSVRLINGRVERLIFLEKEDGLVVKLIEIDSTHYGNR